MINSEGELCYVRGQGLLGAMYWEYAGDTSEGILHQAVYNGIMK